jgi:hypothetical protein
MKKVLLISALFLVFLGCKKDSKVQVEANGLTADINSLVPQTTIDAMVAQGMPIKAIRRLPLTVFSMPPPLF